jgi:hypothetical protein
LTMYGQNRLGRTGRKRILGELKAYLRPPRTILVAILLVEISIIFGKCTFGLLRLHFGSLV